MNYSKEEILFLSHFFDWKNVLASVKELEILSRFTFGQQNFIKKAEILTSKLTSRVETSWEGRKISICFDDYLLNQLNCQNKRKIVSSICCLPEKLNFTKTYSSKDENSCHFFWRLFWFRDWKRYQVFLCFQSYLELNYKLQNPISPGIY